MNSKAIWKVLLVSYLIHAPIYGQEYQRFEYEQKEMGVPFRIRLYACDEGTANKAAAAAFARIAEINRLCSDYDPTSELMRFCQQATPGHPVTLNPELIAILESAESMSERTDGAFDVTVGPLVKLWRRARRQHRYPDRDRLALAREAVGYRKLQLRTTTATLQRPGMRLDLGGIAKGYATDEALRAIRDWGISRALVDGGGDIRVGNPPPGETHWRVEIEPLTAPNESPTSATATTRELRLANCAVATSGDAYQFVELDGRRYSHIIDPRTGTPTTTRSSVTVIAPNGMQADALASALTVLGPHRGIAQLSKRFPHASASITAIEADEPITIESDNFARYVTNPQADCDR